MTDVFISYKREERPRCVAIYNALVDLKLSVWFDAHIEPGTDFDREIEREVRSAKAVLVLWSALAADSDWIRAEARTGRQNERLVAARLDDCFPPLEFASVQAVDLFDARGFQAGDGWRQIVARIGRLAGRSGLGDYVRCEQAADAGLWRGWIAANPGDPLIDVAKQRVEALARPGEREVVSPTAVPAPAPATDAANPMRRYWPLLAGAVLLTGAALALAFGSGDAAKPDAGNFAAKPVAAGPPAATAVTPMASAGQGKLAFCRPDKPYVLTFVTGRSDMPPVGNLTISNIWLAWRECRGPVRVEGHVESSAADDSERMAQTVAGELRAKGIDPKAIATIGAGDDKPLAGAARPDDNRRVEVYLLPPR